YWVCRRAEGTFISTKYLTASNGYAHRERDQPTLHEAGRLMWVPVLHGIQRHYRQILDPSSDPSETWQTPKGCACIAIFRTRQHSTACCSNAWQICPHPGENAVVSYQYRRERHWGRTGRTSSWCPRKRRCDHPRRKRSCRPEAAHR